MGVVGERPSPVRYKSLTIDGNYRIDLLVDDTIVVELKSVEKVLPVLMRRSSRTCVTQKSHLVF